MPFFSRKKKVGEKGAAKADEKPPPQPYRHVPVHAASDARSLAPPTARKEEDRRAIVEQNKRRSVSRPGSMSSTHTMNTLPRNQTWDTFASSSTAQYRFNPAFQNMAALSEERHSMVVPEPSAMRSSSYDSARSLPRITFMPEPPPQSRLRHQFAASVIEPVPEMTPALDVQEISPPPTPKYAFARNSRATWMFETPGQASTQSHSAADVIDFMPDAGQIAIAQEMTPPTSPVKTSSANSSRVSSVLELPVLAPQKRRFHLPGNTVAPLARRVEPVVQESVSFSSDTDSARELSTTTQQQQSIPQPQQQTSPRPRRGVNNHVAEQLSSDPRYHKPGGRSGHRHSSTPKHAPPPPALPALNNSSPYPTLGKRLSGFGIPGTRKSASVAAH